ncbi:allophanate hydrolase subunit 2 [Corynebacterium mustelae]|uniref:Allophanate hydrolase subunit 2 n=1 Tax=Corynebacterium mustelae TaxID=571915 RepID=A0A0G3GY41_9CORY|nr:allophanate hydrolase subunit 2 [Corynebacterium mustelae]
MTDMHDGQSSAILAPPRHDSLPIARVVQAGPLALFQDRGRPGFAAMGVSASGSFDRLSAARANHAVGNAATAPVIELLMGGFVVEFLVSTSVIITGTDAQIIIESVDGRVQRSYTNVIIDVVASDRLQVLTPDYGLRAYLAVRGGFDVAQELGSAARDQLSGIGPAPIMAGDVLWSSRGFIEELQWWPRLRQIPTLWRRVPQEELHVILGPRHDWFSAETIDSFLSQVFTVSADSNRVGVRMIPTAPLARSRAGELASEGMVRGAIQVPPNGHPVVFGPDHPVTGGYPVIAVLTSRACDRCAQLAPGQTVRFKL